MRRDMAIMLAASWLPRKGSGATIPARVRALLRG
jgi:hypothetical protein